MTITIEEFMKRLGEISEYEGISYGRAHHVYNAEEEHANAILQYKGYLALSDAFKCFFLETVELINTESRQHVTQELSEHYAMFVPRLSQSFISICGAERTATRGYPYQGYTLLRNIFDNVILTSGALQEITDFYSIEGIIVSEEYNPDKSRRLRKKTEFAVRKILTGEDSGLSNKTIGEIEEWDKMFDYETHGARLSATHATDWMKGIGELHILPKFDETSFALFMNRFCEVAWMIHRLIPLMQIPDVPLSEKWREKWQILDESFEQTVLSLTEQLEKAIGAAIVELVQNKFPFSGKTVFPL